MAVRLTTSVANSHFPKKKKDSSGYFKYAKLINREAVFSFISRVMCSTRHRLIPVPLVEEILLQETVKIKVIGSVLMWQLQRYKNLK